MLAERVHCFSAADDSVVRIQDGNALEDELRAETRERRKVRLRQRAQLLPRSWTLLADQDQEEIRAEDRCEVFCSDRRSRIETGARDQHAVATGRREEVGHELKRRLPPMFDARLPAPRPLHASSFGRRSSIAEMVRSRKPPRCKVRPCLRITHPPSSRRHQIFPPWP